MNKKLRPQINKIDYIKNTFLQMTVNEIKMLTKLLAIGNCYDYSFGKEQKHKHNLYVITHFE